MEWATSKSTMLDVEVGGQREDGTEHALAVGDGQAQLDQVLGARHPGRAG